MKELVIASDSARGRAFSASLLAYVRLDSWWDEGRSDAFRPAWAMLANTDAEVRAFSANIRSGRRAYVQSGRYKARGEDKFELLKTAGYEYSWQREAEGSILTAHVPRFFRVDPGMVDPRGVEFVVLARSRWLAEQVVETKNAAAHARRLGYGLAEEDAETIVPAAYLFAAMLDRRTRCPILSDARFFVQVLAASLKEGIASLSRKSEYGEQGFGVHPNVGLDSHGLEDVGLARAIAFRASHAAVEAMLAEETRKFFELVPRWRAGGGAR